MLQLSHRDHGGEGNPPIVLLHGMLGSSRNWQTAGRDLAARYHVFALDGRNHGNSPPAAAMTYAAMVGDVLGWLDDRQIARTTLAGHSMGGKTAMLLACRHPERVARLVVVDIAPVNYLWPAHRDEFAAMLELDLATLTSRTDAEHRFKARIKSPGMRKFLATNLAQDDAGRWRWAINLPALTESLVAMESNPLAPGDRYDGPTLFIAGAKSRYVQPADHVPIKRHFPAARIEFVPDCGHNPHLDKRAEFVRTVLAGA